MKPLNFFAYFQNTQVHRLIVLHGNFYSNNRFVINALCFLIFCCSFWLFI